MCGLIVTTKSRTRIREANFFVGRRGPDRTNVIEKGNFTFLHDLLSITGAFTPQPFVDDENDIVALFNGQIYNYLDFGSYASDGEALIPMYKRYGEEFIRHFDGEFAIVLVDFKKKLLIVSTDVFATKPLWMGLERKDVGLASYKSALESLGFTAPEKMPANTTRIYQLSGAGITLLRTKTVFDFDLQQKKDMLDDFFAAFEKAVEKRTRNLREKIFIGLSSGYDSGALALAMTRLNVHFEAYSIPGEENKAVLKARHELLAYPPHLLDFSYPDFLRSKLYLQKYAEPHEMRINPDHKNRDVRNDPGAIGLSYICSIAKKDGVKIYLSGQGSDEIISDYGMDGKKLSSHSTFAGVFPDDLAPAFPWKNFYGGAQEDYIAKEEHVSGSHGIEGRYPFLDARFVQEFLWLSPGLKNKEYKYPLAEYLRKYHYPFAEGFKKGFVLGVFPLESRLQWGTVEVIRDSLLGRI